MSAQLQPQSHEQLQEAFRAFTEVSRQLEGSYRELEARAARLSEELAAARGERLRQLAEKERLANRLTSLLEALPGGVVVLDADGCVQECNPAARDLLGEPLIGLAWREVAQRAFAPRRGDSQEIGLRDGRCVRVSTRSLGEEPGRILLLNDVTETRALQELVSRNRRLSAMGEMAAGLAHQIRTPLASALLYVSHLDRPGLQPAQCTRVAAKILARLRHMDAMVNEMLAFARGAAPRPDEFAVRTLLAELEQALEPQLAAHGAVLERRGDAGAVLCGNRQALLGALLNLATNALQACPEDPHLILEVTGSGTHLDIALHDNGPGIPEEIRDRLFDPFFTTRPDGTGLGLAVVRSTAEGHGGEVLVRSSPGRGSCFVLRLPLETRTDLLPSGAGVALAMAQDSRARPRRAPSDAGMTNE